MSLARRAWNPKSKNCYRGYYPVTPNVTCYKEGLSLAKELPVDDPLRISGNVMYEPNQWPPESEPGAVAFRQFMVAYFDCMFELGLEVTRLLAIGIGKEESYFDQLFLDKSVSTLRLMHYPLRSRPVPDAAIKDGQVLTCLEHTDTNYVTFLSTFQNEGLQILTKEGEWIDVELCPDCVVMNAGETLVKTAGKQFRATMHRVVDRGEERFSVPFFLEPAYFSDLGSYERESNGEGGKEGDTIPYGPWLSKRMIEKNYSDFPTASFGNKN